MNIVDYIATLGLPMTMSHIRRFIVLKQVRYNDTLVSIDFNVPLAKGDKLTIANYEKVIE